MEFQTQEYGEPTKDFGQEDSVLVSTKTFLYGNEYKPDMDVKFIIGMSEFNRKAAGNAGEKDRMKRKWDKLNSIAHGEDKHPWRKTLSNKFDRYPIYASSNSAVTKGRPIGYMTMNFTLDGNEWRSVIHYLIAMLYRNNPEYSILFSLSQKENEQGFWDTTENALAEHNRNINNLNMGGYEPDPNFIMMLPKYIFYANLAKLSQYPTLKEILLLTQDAYLNEREGDLIVGLPWLMKIRSIFREYPNAVFDSSDGNMKEEMSKRMEIKRNPETLNPNYIEDDDDSENPVAGNVLLSTLHRRIDLRMFLDQRGIIGDISREPISESENWVYMYTSPVDIDPFAFDIFDQKYERTYIKRHIYGLKRVQDDSLNYIMVGIESTPTSKISEYIQIILPGVASFYFEPFENGYGVMAISERKNDKLLWFIQKMPNTLVDGAGLDIPDFATISERVETITREKRLVETSKSPSLVSLTLNQILWQYNKIQNLTKNARIKGMSPLEQKNFLEDLREELIKRSYENGENLLQSSDYTFSKYWSSRNGWSPSWLESILHIPEFPTTMREEDLAVTINHPVAFNNFNSFYDVGNPLNSEEQNNIAKSMSLKSYVLHDTLGELELGWYTPRSFIDELEISNPFDKILFRSARKDFREESFRGNDWLKEMPPQTESSTILTNMQAGTKIRIVRLYAEVPSIESIHNTFIERLNILMNQSIKSDIYMEIILVVDEDTPIYNFVLDDPKAVFKYLIKPGAAEENAYTQDVRSSQKPKFLAVMRSHPDSEYTGLDLKRLAEMLM